MLFCWWCRLGQVRRPCSCTKCLQLQKWKLKRNGEWQGWSQNCTFCGKNRCKTSCLTLKNAEATENAFISMFMKNGPLGACGKQMLPCSDLLRAGCKPDSAELWHFRKKDNIICLGEQPWRDTSAAVMEIEVWVYACETLCHKCVIISDTPFCRQETEIGPCSHWVAETTFSLSCHSQRTVVLLAWPYEVGLKTCNCSRDRTAPLNYHNSFFSVSFYVSREGV